jgi:hypothetical protein
MFDLERAIIGWRQNMVSDGVISTEVLDELEAHLREDVEHRMAAGVDAQMAFQAATKAMGAPGLLHGEFVKAESPRYLRKWFPVLFYVLAVAFLLISVWTLFAYEVSRWQLNAGTLALFAICFSLLVFPKFSGSLSQGGQNWFAKGFKVTSGVLVFWPGFALLEALNMIHLPIGIVASVVIWNLYAAFALVGCWSVLVTRFHSGGSGGFGQSGRPVPAVPPRSPSDPVVQQIVRLAGEEAQRLGHDFIGTEHVLLGLLRLAQGSFVNVLRKLNVDPATVRADIERLVSPVQLGFHPAARPLTPRAGRAVDFAAREARGSQQGITAEHLFLGLLLEGSGVAAVVLRKLGVRVEQARQEIRNERGARGR